LVPEGGDFLYYADGQVKFAADLRTASTGGWHDRAYSYDHAGRLKEAYSGVQARNFRDGTQTPFYGSMPFRQSYGYDAWENMTSRTGWYWSAEDTTSETFNQQGRNPAWEYDPEGRFVSRNEAEPHALPYEPLRAAFDAAGRLTSRTQATSQPSHNNPEVRVKTTVTQAEVYDGDGQAVRHITTRQEGSHPASTEVKYYLRSSVLGRVIAEYNAAGARLSSYVPAGGGVAARQAGETLYWQHTNPVTGDEVETDSAGRATARATLDPGGVSLGDSDPFASSPGGGEGEGTTQAEMNARYAQLLPPSMGGNALQVNVVGAFQMSAFSAYALAGMGAAVIVHGNVQSGRFVTFKNDPALLDRNRNTSTRRWAPLTAVGNWVGYLPEGAKIGPGGVFHYRPPRDSRPGK